MKDKLLRIVYDKMGAFIKNELKIDNICDYLEYKSFIKNLEKNNIIVKKDICKNKVLTNLRIFIPTNVWICDIFCNYNNKEITITIVLRIINNKIDVEDIKVKRIENEDELIDFKFLIENIAKKSFKSFVYNKEKYINMFLEKNLSIDEKKLNYYLEY